MEPSDPPQIKGYSKHGSKKWEYKFDWQGGEGVTSGTGWLNNDIALEWCNMTIVKAGRSANNQIAPRNTVIPRSSNNEFHGCDVSYLQELRFLNDFIAESDSTGITVPTSDLDSAVRDDFDEYKRARSRFWKCATATRSTCEPLGDPAATLRNLNDALEAAMTARNVSLEQAHLDTYTAVLSGRRSAATTPFLPETPAT